MISRRTKLQDDKDHGRRTKLRATLGSKKDEDGGEIEDEAGEESPQDEIDAGATDEEIELENEQKYCWVTETSRNILVRSTLDSPSGKISGLLLQSI